MRGNIGKGARRIGCSLRIGFQEHKVLPKNVITSHVRHLRWYSHYSMSIVKNQQAGPSRLLLESTQDLLTMSA